MRQTHKTHMKELSACCIDIVYYIWGEREGEKEQGPEGMQSSNKAQPASRGLVYM